NLVALSRGGQTNSPVYSNLLAERQQQIALRATYTAGLWDVIAPPTATRTVTRSASKSRYLGKSFLLAALVALALVILLELFDQRARTSSGVGRLLGGHDVGEVPRLAAPDPSSLILRTQPASAEAESFRAVRGALKLRLPFSPCITLIASLRDATVSSV